MPGLCAQTACRTREETTSDTDRVGVRVLFPLQHKLGGEMQPHQRAFREGQA